MPLAALPRRVRESVCLLSVQCSAAQRSAGVRRKYCLSVGFSLSFFFCLLTRDWS